MPLLCPGVLLHFSFVCGNPLLHSRPVWHPQLLSPTSFHPLSFATPFPWPSSGPKALLICLLLFLSSGKYVYSSGLSELCSYLSYLAKRESLLSWTNIPIHQRNTTGYPVGCHSSANSVETLYVTYKGLYFLEVTFSQWPLNVVRGQLTGFR